VAIMEKKVVVEENAAPKRAAVKRTPKKKAD
jgi:hypothetical protein